MYMYMSICICITTLPHFFFLKYIRTIDVGIEKFKQPLFKWLDGVPPTCG